MSSVTPAHARPRRVTAALARARLITLVLGGILSLGLLGTLAVTVPAADAAVSAEAARTPATAAAAKAVRYAVRQIGDPYVWGASGPNAYDCSGLTWRSYRKADTVIPRVSRDQYRIGTKVSRGSWQRGDLIFWASNRGRPSTIYHVGMYMGGGKVLHAPRPGKSVEIARIWGSPLPLAVRPG